MRTFTSILIGALALVAGSAQAQSFPTKPIRLIVPFAPGGPSDISARLLATGLNDVLGQVIVENRPGAGAAVGAQALLAAPADGYTLMMGSNVLSSGKFLFDNLPYDTLNDFRGVGGVSISPLAMLVAPNVPANNLQEFIKFVKEKPGGANYASAGAGTVPQLGTEWFLQKVGLKMTHIPYRGSSAALPALKAGEVDLYFDIAITGQAAANDGAKVLAVTGDKRLNVFPNVPTMIELGYGDFQVYSWFGIVTRKQVPDAIVTQINIAMNKVQATEAFSKTLNNLGSAPLTGTAAEFQKLYTDELALWGRLIPGMNIKISN
jgi:tripartite-type tricarboxylate transporter receptor subunit TctC